MDRNRLQRVVLIGLTAAGLVACGGGERSAAPTNGKACVAPPALTIDSEVLDAALTCSDNLGTSAQPAVLLIPGTATTPETVHSWNYARAFTQQQRPFCTLELPESMLVDIQDSAEYFVHAVRVMHGTTGRPVKVVGYSQGGMMPRWGIKHFPDIRPMVEELISLSASNHGTIIAEPTCNPDCAPAIWQQRDNANLIAALNSGGETFAGIDYTSVYTRNDEIVVPNTGPEPSSALRDGGDNVRNIAIQEVCPTATSEHLAIGTYDPVAYALVIDALNHEGVADPERLPGAVAGQPGTASACAMVTHEGVDQTQFVQNFAALNASIGEAIQNGPRTTAEPPLRCYVDAAD